MQDSDERNEAVPSSPMAETSAGQAMAGAVDALKSVDWNAVGSAACSKAALLIGAAAAGLAALVKGIDWGKVRAALGTRTGKRAGLALGVVTAFVVGGYCAKGDVWPYRNGKMFGGKVVHEEFATYERDKVWAENLRKGGYILYVRHAQREKWIDVTAFDAVELATRADASMASYRRAVCLTEQGIEEAKLIGEVFRLSDIKVDKVISSPSCRARQTAMHAFGKIDGIRNSLLHRTAIMQDQHEEFARDMRKMIDGLVPSAGSNIVLSAHAGTFRFDKDILLDVNETGQPPDNRDETGFVVLEKKDGKLIARHVFRSIRHVSNAAIRLPLYNPGPEKPGREISKL
jgi:broad specificity phosphatase PhoE